MKNALSLFIISLVSLTQPLLVHADLIWTQDIIDSDRASSEYTSIICDEYNRYVAYYAASGHNLKYAFYDGGDWTTETVLSDGDVGQYCSIAIDSNGVPHIVCYDATNTRLLIVENPGPGWSIGEVDGAYSDVGKYTSIAIDSGGTVHISYYDVTNGNLKYATVIDAEVTTYTVASSGDVGKYSSIALDSNDNPYISYYDATNSNLKCAHKSGPFWSISIVDSSTNVGTYSSIDLDSSNVPYISYYDAQNKDLKLAKYINSNWTKSTIDSTGDVGKYSSIVCDYFDCLWISYHDETNGALKCYWNYGSGYEFWNVDSGYDAGLGSAIDTEKYYDEWPRISYFGDTYDDGYELRVMSLDNYTTAGKSSNLKELPTTN